MIKSGAVVKPCATVPEAASAVKVTIENPLVVFALILVAAVDPANVDVEATPSIITEPDVGALPAPALFVAVGAPPASQHQATKPSEPDGSLAEPPAPTENPSASNEISSVLLLLCAAVVF